MTISDGEHGDDAVEAEPIWRSPAPVFGQFNDPLRFQQRWKARYPNMRQVKVPRGNHFPLCDDPQLVADELRAFAYRG